MTDDGALEPLRPIPLAAAEGWAKVCANKRLGEPMRRAMYLVAIGATPALATRLVGLAQGSTSRVYEAAQNFGLYTPSSERIMGVTKALALDSNLELLTRVREKPEDISTRDLVVTGGVSIDKVAKYENWGRADTDTGDYAGALKEMARELAAAGGTVKLELTVEPGNAGRDDPEPDTIEAEIVKED